ncbi:hypothetical protein DHEL01_v210250 [Diaporthe helianthi]|uniref:Uncharacterized protein n=1 Tax=Diaporthe helianthi TaxID=158607 RepID=A0A2P5HMA7_DIAHE|nr:hypothetical protein DHEL01_v210250 [Diaporthe helianthi]
MPEPGNEPEAGKAPDAGNTPRTAIKRSQSDLETTEPDEKISEEPDVKKQKLEEVAAPVQQLNIINIDPAGDLLILCNKKAFKVDSSAIKRVTPSVYKRCLAQRPVDDSAWTSSFRDMSEIMEEAVSVILNLIHANLDKIPESIHWVTMFYLIVLAKRFKVFDRFLVPFKRWYQGGLLLQPIPSTCNVRKSTCLWISYHLGLEENFKVLQRWAIFNLCDDGKGTLVYPPKQVDGTRSKLSTSYLADKVVTDRIAKLRSSAISFIMVSLKTAQLTLFPEGQFARDGRIKNSLGGFACPKCMDLWFGCLGKSLLRPNLFLASLEPGFPRLSDVIEIPNTQFYLPLERLCSFIDKVQEKMDGYPACGRRGQWACVPPRLVGRMAVEDLIAKGMQEPLGAT